MPYRTPHGKKYHTVMGCHGAVISCSASGMEPCRHCDPSRGRRLRGGVVNGAPMPAGGTPTGGRGPSAPHGDPRPLLTAPLGAEEVSDALSKAGFPCHAVGGCVRDALLGREPHDWDLTTSATVDDMRDAFRKAGIRTYDTGIAHGTITALGSDGEGYEVTTYRIDGDYSDGRHPDSVAFTDSLEEDLARRDLTINAMAWSADGGLVDPFGGADDLRDRTIRSVGDPRARMSEDSLRVMRAMRFSSILGFGIEARTDAAMHELAPLLSRVSGERKRDEMTKMLSASDTAMLARNLRRYADIVFEVVPELRACADTPQRHPWHRFDNVWDHTVEVVANTPPDPVLRMAALLHDAGKPACLEIDGDDGRTSFRGHPSVSTEIAGAVLTRLHFDNQTASRIRLLVAEHDRDVQATKRSVRRALVRFGDRETFDLWWNLRRADVMGQSDYAQAQELPMLDRVREIADTLAEEESLFAMSDMRLRGADLIDLGMEPGPEMGQLLKEAFGKVIDGELPNDPDALRAFAMGRLAGTR